MKTLPTAEEFYIQKGYMPNTHRLGYDIKTAMIEFAKLHVEQALEEAFRNCEIIKDHQGNPKVFSSSILNAYSLENIK